MNKHANFQHLLLNAMRIGGFQILILILTIACLKAEDIRGQDLTAQEFSISTGQTELINILNKIEEKTDLTFTFSVQKIDMHQIAELSAKRLPLSEIVDNFFEKLGISYKVYNQQYIVLSKESRRKKRVGVVLSGEVITGNQEPIQFANISLINTSDQSIFKGSVSDEFGKFEIADIRKGEYNLNISYLGMESFDTTFVIDRSIDLGKKILKEKDNVLEGVSISARRKLIRQEIDRLVLNVENSILATRGDVLEVLKSTPGISVINDRISMIGKSSVGIMVNEKPIQLPPEELADYLRSISSEDVLEIEIISTPPAKYEAAGNSGLINIVLKKAKRDSWNAMLRSGYWQRRFASESAGANFNFNKKKLSLASSLYWTDASYYQEQDDYAYFEDALWYTQSPFRNDYKRFSIRLDANYQMSPKWEIGAQYVRNDGSNFATDSPYTPVTDNVTGEILRFLQSKNSTIDQKPKFNSYNVNNTFQLDTSGKKLTLNLDYFTFENPDTRNYDGISVVNNPMTTQFYAGTNTNRQMVENMSGTIDLEIPTSWMNFEIGGKVVNSHSTNDITLFNSGIVENEVTDLPLSANDFTYQEDLQAVYLSGTKKINDKVSVQVGARVESTQTHSTSENAEVDETNDYTKVFPTAYIAYKASKKNSYSINYSRRISRPSFWQLNPNTFFINPFQVILGNPFLQPSFTDNFEINHNTGSLTGKLYYSFEKDIFAQVPLANSNTNFITFAHENYIDTRRFGISEYYTFDKLKWWSSSNSVDVNYSLSTFDLKEDQPDLSGFNSRISTSNDFSIPGNSNWSFNLSYWYAFRGNLYIFETLPLSNLSASVQFKALNNKLKIGITANDILKTQADRTETIVNGVFQTARYYYDSRSLYLSVSYSFGNNEIRAKRHQTGNRDEAKRTGN